MPFKQRIINWILKRLTLQIEVEDIFTYNPRTNTLLIGGRALQDKEINVLQQEVRYLEESSIWKVWNNTVRDQAKQRMFEKALSYDDMVAGKMMLKNLDLIGEINVRIKRWKPIESARTTLPKYNEPIEH